MTKIHRLAETELEQNKSRFPDFSWKASVPLEALSGAKYLHFDIKSLHPGKYSFHDGSPARWRPNAPGHSVLTSWFSFIT